MGKLSNILRGILGRKYGWFGNYSSWEEAEEHTSGYNEAHILEKVKNSLLKVKNGEATAERDSVLFDEIQYSWPLLANILNIACSKNGHLNVIDFGGSLGSTYFQNSKYLSELKSVSWNIIEQDAFVKVGRKHFADNVLAFYNTLEECIEIKGKADLIILSCVLPYLPKPYTILSKLMNCGAQYIIIENTPLQDIKSEDVLCIQKVHPSIYEASYPCWLLNREKVYNFLKQEYSLYIAYKNETVISWESFKIQYSGAVFQRK